MVELGGALGDVLAGLLGGGGTGTGVPGPGLTGGTLGAELAGAAAGRSICPEKDADGLQGLSTGGLPAGWLGAGGFWQLTASTSFSPGLKRNGWRKW